MADEHAQEEKKPDKPGLIKRMFPRLRNWWVMNIRSATKAPFHEIKPEGQPITTLKIYEDLQAVLNFKDIGTLNEEVIKAERFWEGGIPEAEEISASHFMNQTKALYRELGPYYDKLAISKEMSLTQHNYETVRESLNIDIKGLGIRTFVFSLPKEKEIAFNHGLKYTVGYIGHNNQAYYNTLKREISSFCDSIERELKDKYVGSTKEIVEKKIKSIRNQILDLFGPLQKFLTAFENERRSELSKLSEKANQSIEGLMDSVKSRRLIPDWVIYRHTYRIIKQKIQETIKYPLEEVIVSEDLPDFYKIEKVKDFSGKEIEDELIVDIYFNPEINPTRDEMDYVNKKLDELNMQGIVGSIRTTYESIKVLQRDLSELNKSLGEKSRQIIMDFLKNSVLDKKTIGNITRVLNKTESEQLINILIEWLTGLLYNDENYLKAEVSSLLEDLNNQLKRFTESELKDDINNIIRKIAANIETIFRSLQDECGKLKGISLESFKKLSERKELLEKHKNNLVDCLMLEIRKKQLDFIMHHVNFAGHLQQFEIRENEVDYGLDQNGWQLEVAEQGYIFEVPNEDGTFGRESIAPGTVLLDVFNRKAPYRKVNLEEWTEYCDLLDMATWIYVSYDAYRDDLRDGRYHKNSLSVTEYLLQMDGIETPYLDFNKKGLDQELTEEVNENGVTKKVIKATDRVTSTLTINGPPFPQNAPANKQVEIKMESSHLNPAIDLRRGSVSENSRKDKHLGRKLYYDVQDNMEQSKNPTITTRGAALYILASVLERVKYWNEAIELMDAIGNDTNGFDIGPNLQGLVKSKTDPKTGDHKLEVVPQRWGVSFTKNPFKPIGLAGK